MPGSALIRSTAPKNGVKTLEGEALGGKGSGNPNLVPPDPKKPRKSWWSKGQSPLGARARLTKDVFRRDINAQLMTTIESVKEIYADKKTNAINAIIASMILRAYATGQYHLVQPLVERLIGTVEDDKKKGIRPTLQIFSADGTPRLALSSTALGDDDVEEGEVIDE